ncbi:MULTISPECIES: tripartite tricarboxylate transporter substrate binding protein [unclassified Variovorax]|uniref:Bug family tripartite tricarboxylate transporter substrate binding protein n=1 Tax=unclassified Variovorax TaxID=663243 RepID=UPI002577485B|nr:MULTISPECIES: tripartite tricarboxylate transporter substrate binding protein [unclassified Variovorax]MDM0088915.1 tripartite tricarboxylate transporter substrate binding protein [Variovorax sp. J22G40]MDM0146988.1 tripartite tricarboxylate transporter substrate binding protein [Variovorax sp. J2P1-31]
MNPLRRALLGTAALALAMAAHAQGSYPSQPIRIIVPFPPGGPADALARVVSNKLAPLLGQPVLVDNRAGAGGTLGVNLVAKSRPDGYTLVLVGPGPLVVLPSVARLPYDPLRDLQPITQLVTAPMVVLTSGTSRFNSLGDVVKAARARPGTLNYASSGAGNSNHIASELLKRETGIDMQHVPYKGAGTALTALMAGDTEVGILDMPGLPAQLQGGRLKALAVTSAQRSPMLPEVPTTAEAGYPSVQATSWFGLFAAAQTPREVVMKLNRSVVSVLKEPDVQEAVTKLGAQIVAGSPEAFEAFVRSEAGRWGPIAVSVGIRLE